MATGIGCTTGVVMVMCKSVAGTLSQTIHQGAPSWRLMHRLDPVRDCQSLGPLSTLRRVKSYQFSEYLEVAALFLLVDGARIRPKIHLPDVSSSSRLVKAMKWWPLAVVWVPTVWSKVVYPEADSAMSTATVSGRESMLICVPSGAMSWFDWLSSEARFLVVFFLSQFAAEVSIFDGAPATGGLGCWLLGG